MVERLACLPVCLLSATSQSASTSPSHPKPWRLNGRDGHSRHRPKPWWCGGYGLAGSRSVVGGFDQYMLAYDYLPRGHDQMFSPRMLSLREQCLEKAHSLSMGVVAMKIIGGGIRGAWSGHIVSTFDTNRLNRLPGAAMRYVLSNKRVHMLTIGMRLRTDIDANIKTLAGDVTCTDADRALLAEFGPQALNSDTMSRMRVE